MKLPCTLILLMGCLNLTSCNLFFGGEEHKTELEKLPPITQTGKTTFGCLVNGKAFVVSNTSKQVAIFQQGQLQFGASQDSDNKDESLSMNLIDPLDINEAYLFDGVIYYSGYSLRIGNAICIYEFDSTFEGSITFSKIDRINYIISGTFEFSTVTASCDTIRITNGRFDMQYIP